MEKPDFVNRAEDAIDEHTAPASGERKYEAGGERPVLRREQQEEAAESWVGPGFTAMTGGQAHGLVYGALIGAALGALLFLPLAFVPFADGVLVRILVVVLVGVLAGATAGTLYVGGREPELEGETMDVNGRGSVGTTLRDPHTDARGR